MHWVYVIKCANNIIYVGETKRLYRRLNEHCNKDSGSCTTHDFYPQSLICLYKVEDDFKLINKITHPIHYDMHEKGYLNENKTSALELENYITEMSMQSMGPYWKNVYGGKYHIGFRPNENPSKDCLFKRPFCNCKRPADIKEWKGKKYWRCAKKNIWDKLKDYVLNELAFSYQNDACNFYCDYNPDSNFNCENLIYEYKINNYTCQLLSDSDDE